MLVQLLFDGVEARAEEFLGSPVELDERSKPVGPALGPDHVRTLTVTFADRPARSCLNPGWLGRSLIRTGTRWTIFVKLPVPGSNGSREKVDPDPGAKLSTTPSSGRPSASTLMRTGWPGRMSRTCVSLKFAVT
jgi:hypothetical protein